MLKNQICKVVEGPSTRTNRPVEFPTYIVEKSKFLVAFLCCQLVFEFSVGTYIGVYVIKLSDISFFVSS